MAALAFHDEELQDIYEQRMVRLSLRELIDAGMGEEEASRQILRRTERNLLEDMMYPLVLSEARNMRRSRTRSTERKVNRVIEAGTDPVSAMLALLPGEGFWVDGDYISWLDATAAQHLQRAEKQSRLMAGIATNINLHRSAAALIIEAGVTCLRDLVDPTLTERNSQ